MFEPKETNAWYVITAGLHLVAAVNGNYGID